MDDIVEKLKGFSTTIISDAMGGFGTMSNMIKPIVDTMKIAARAYTVHCFHRDNLMAHYAIKHAPKSSVLVIATGFDRDGAYWGELMSLMAKKQGIVGIVTDGGIRDKDMIIKLNFPVFAASVTPSRTAKATPGNVNCLVNCGGVTVNPNDIIIADSNGVVVVPYDKAEKIYELSKANLEKESYLREHIAAGELLFDIFAMEKLIHKEE
ncbi:MAG: 4-hydroxy-4-methyl-2-oxoglutarate aldolase [Spirochaetes bacterium]|nr:RraA family protein [Deltaproteobacteria bacterium]RKY03818.1 MAG: 4-hydroxy-4-methyl-2-oxoglutarate aldolase [Spirochaetota bacterium]